MKRYDNTTISVIVKGSTQGETTYTIVAVKPPEPDATLKVLTIGTGTLLPAFKPLVLTYAADEGPEQATIAINAVANDTDAQVKINGRLADRTTGKWPPVPIASGRTTTVRFPSIFPRFSSNISTFTPFDPTSALFYTTFAQSPGRMIRSSSQC